MTKNPYVIRDDEMKQECVKIDNTQNIKISDNTMCKYKKEVNELKIMNCNHSYLQSTARSNYSKSSTLNPGNIINTETGEKPTNIDIIQSWSATGYLKQLVKSKELENGD